MNAAEVKEVLLMAVLFFTLWRVVRLELTVTKLHADLDHQIDLLRVYKEDKK